MRHFFRNTGRVLGTLCLCLMPLNVASKDELSPEGASLVVEAAFPPEITAMFPVGRIFKGVTIPSYTGENLKSVMRASSVTRIDERYLDLTDLIVLVYDSREKAETTISMEQAAYDMQTGELRSKTPSRIEQSKFVMTGDKMIFHQQSQVSKLKGNVRVIIPDANQFGPSMGLPSSK